MPKACTERNGSFAEHLLRLASEYHMPGHSIPFKSRLSALQQEVQQEPPGRPGTEPELTGHWTLLVDLLCGSDAWGIRLGQQWLHNLLVTAAETSLVHSHLPQQAGLALLPSLSPQVGRSRMDGVHAAIKLVPQQCSVGCPQHWQ